MNKLALDIYDLMLENWELWICTEYGTAMIVSDCSLLDC